MHRYKVKYIDANGNMVNKTLNTYSGRHAIQEIQEEYGKKSVVKVTREGTGTVVFDRT